MEKCKADNRVSLFLLGQDRAISPTITGICPNQKSFNQASFCLHQKQALEQPPKFLWLGKTFSLTGKKIFPDRGAKIPQKELLQQAPNKLRTIINRISRFICTFAQNKTHPT